MTGRLSTTVIYGAYGASDGLLMEEIRKGEEKSYLALCLVSTMAFFVPFVI